MDDIIATIVTNKNMTTSIILLKTDFIQIILPLPKDGFA